MRFNYKAIALASIIMMGANVCISAKRTKAPAPAPSPTADSITMQNPDMKVFLPRNPTGRGVVVCPGGCYMGHAIAHEGYDWIPFFNERGIAVAVLTYRLPQGDRTKPISDAEKAIETLRDSASVWHLNPDDIGIMGSSAGGHLAATVSIQSTGRSKPDFQILFYPWISMFRPHNVPVKMAYASFFGENNSPSLDREYSCQLQVRPDTPRAFIAISDDDSAVSTVSGTEYYMALHDAGIPASLHIYANGEHGWGFNNFDYHDTMLKHLNKWLERF